MSVLSFLTQGIILGVSAAASPGPFQAYLISQSLRLGWRRALPVALAPLISDGPIVLLVLLVLTRMPDELLRILQIAGGVFMIYLAWKALQAYRSFDQRGPAGEQERQSLVQAAMMNFLSPGPYVFWSILAGPILLRGWAMGPGNGIGFIFGFYGALVACLAVLVILFGSAGRLGPRATRILLGLSALALFGFGIYQLVTGLFGSQMV